MAKILQNCIHCRLHAVLPVKPFKSPRKTKPQRAHLSGAFHLCRCKLIHLLYSLAIVPFSLAVAESLVLNQVCWHIHTCMHYCIYIIIIWNRFQVHLALCTTISMLSLDNAQKTNNMLYWHGFIPLRWFRVLVCRSRKTFMRFVFVYAIVYQTCNELKKNAQNNA